MNIALATRQTKDVTVLDLSGRLTIGEGVGVVRDTIHDLLATGQKKLLLNLAEVSYIDSGGLGGLISARTTVAEQGAKLKLFNLTKRVHDLLRITHTDKIFEVYQDEAAALNSF